MKMCGNKAGRNRRYLTLLELVIVLGILAVLTSAVLPLFEDLEQRDRVKRTEALGRRLQQAIGDGAYAKFISDLGRLPNTYPGLTELYCNPGPADGDDEPRLTARNLTFDNSDLNYSDIEIPEVTMFSGWNGPYLDLDARELQVDPAALWRDAWGHPWQYRLIDGSWTENPAVGVIVYGIRSLGSDGVTDGSEDASDLWHAADLTFLFQPLPMAARMTAATLTVGVYRRETRDNTLVTAENHATVRNEIDGVVSASSWTARTSYALGSYIKETDSAGQSVGFRCDQHETGGKFGLSGNSEPEPWQTEANTDDYQLKWEYYAGIPAGTIPLWTANQVYYRGDMVRNTAGQYFRCSEIVAGAGSGVSEPSWPLAEFRPYGVGIKDHQLLWRCIYPPPARALNDLAVLLFIPETHSEDSGEESIHLTRIRACRSGETLTFQTAASDGGSSSHGGTYYNPDASSSFHVFQMKNLPPGRRRIYVYGHLATNFNRCSSGVLEIDLRPGENHLRVELTDENN